MERDQLEYYKEREEGREGPLRDLLRFFCFRLGKNHPFVGGFLGLLANL